MVQVAGAVPKGQQDLGLEIQEDGEMSRGTGDELDRGRYHCFVSPPGLAAPSVMSARSRATSHPGAAQRRHLRPDPDADSV